MRSDAAHPSRPDLRPNDFDEFVQLQTGLDAQAEGDLEREHPDGRWRSYDYEELLKRDKLSLDLFWIKDKSLTDTDSLPAPGVLAAEIADDLEAALAQFTKIAAKLAKTASSNSTTKPANVRVKTQAADRKTPPLG